QDLRGGDPLARGAEGVERRPIGRRLAPGQLLEDRGDAVAPFEGPDDRLVHPAALVHQGAALEMQVDRELLQRREIREEEMVRVRLVPAARTRNLRQRTADQGLVDRRV